MSKPLAEEAVQRPIAKEGSEIHYYNPLFWRYIVNFTEKLVADVAAQAAEIAELKKTRADLVNPPQPEPGKVDTWRDDIPAWTHEQHGLDCG